MRRGLFARQERAPRRPDPVRRPERTEVVEPDPEALALWRESRPAIGTIIEKHFREVRGITIPPPPSLRFSMQPYQDRIVLPAMIAAVQGPDRRVIAVQTTWIDPRTYQRVGERSNTGSLGTGAVRLAAATEILGLTEGTETGAAAMQLHGIPTWATLGSRMHCVTVPDSVSELVLFGDNGQPGHKFVADAIEQHARAGRRIIPSFPPESFKDWAEVTAARRT
jgi:hypothetical protein